MSSSAELTRAYRDCRRIAAAHGRTYFLATRLLSPEQRPAVHALYAFARLVDDIVDHTSGRDHAKSSAAHLDDIERDLRTRLRRLSGDDAITAAAADEATMPGGEPTVASIIRTVAASADTEARDPRSRVLAAVADTIHRYAIAPEHFWVFLDSMRMDVPGSPLFRDRYPSMAALREYMAGSAAAIGLQLLPVLGTVVPTAAAEPAAAALGEAFQLTNFLRDVGEDLDRGRVYLPADELTAFGVHDDLLRHCRATGRTDPRVRRALAHLIATNRAVYRTATPGIDLLRPRVRPAIRTAAALYAGILDEIERHDYEIFTRRATVPRHRRLRVAAREFATARHATRATDRLGLRRVVAGGGIVSAR
ncbi:phytoene/squalene synthase family protein [Nocardia otitidiscaviarum]|uniref:Phytoene/squalene synthase family protein n=1 Tax=Nocardia otitidiscaviarum TaxID=1823 RepID=A0A516NIM3_9NOCA|nr:phytoene/squalene synthase family protein [Nocardia otitidiscaviarum]MCP9619853.1 phytoene/squalene synthase family protein [Nocardia otitidiscaviarum]QDP78750.1 phytoene/squalene synthase family protein [Nocardia otitidiscaviarum]